MINQSHEAWIEKLSARYVGDSQLAAIRRTSREDPQDESLPVFKQLLDRGYSKVRWDSGNSSHDECKALNGKEWELNDFISGTTHDAPIFSRSHPGDRSCRVIVSGEGLEDCVVGPWPHWE